MTTTARECARRIAGEHIGCLIVVENDKPCGIVTERSFVHLVKKGRIDPDRITAANFMSSPLISVTPSTGFRAAIELFNRKGVKRLPVVKGGRIIGLLTLKDMVEYSHLALTRLTEKHRKLKSQSAIDPLTGVLNKAAITTAIRNEYERLRRYGGRSSVLFVDIDHFKRVNDEYSHLAGDAVLKELGALLRQVSREIDTVGRFGGEEFVIVAPNRKKYHAVVFGERLRKAVEDHTFTIPGAKLKLTISVGIASLFEGRDYTFALERADKALYHAKHMGRNRIGLWREGKLSIATEHVGAEEDDSAQPEAPPLHLC
jgi:diguanylate cyclase (GGDEF)-like protein